ncbi:MAG: hypothetical protein GY832_21780 [Chloroflexi bacterium]|nr:hypothetical protein [Chloroflexota bacterium]
MQKAREELEATDVAAVWGVELAAVHCARCGEAHLVPEDAIPSRCPFCLQGPVAPQPAYLREEPPEQILPHTISKQKLARMLEQWTQGVRFRPDEFKAEVLMRRARHYFVPLWLVDGQVEGAWRADVGFDYQAVSYQDRYRDGQGWSSQEVKEGRIRWEPRVGRISRSYENVAAPALDDHRALMNRLGDFDLGQRTNYAPQTITTGTIRIPTLEPEAAWDGVKAAFNHAAGAECRQAAGADHIRDLRPEVEYGNLNWTQLLLPAYVTWYREGERIWPVLINGQSGHVSGVRRASTRKANVTSLVLGAIAAMLFVLGGLLALLLPPVGGLMLVFGLLLGLVAPIPAIGVWVFNRRSTPDD